MYAVRFIFVRFNLYERVLMILSVTERHTSLESSVNKITLRTHSLCGLSRYAKTREQP